ncbi:hypothetical protein C8Q76DRAFT_326415 [Earliella scabrosa]|nr:hypothetical protein C8Q76DRAFT_804504 [Earliella scabrosa]KAI0682038.1 hypothetical protein C8Q76DRAFT_326415 [Earliella scabrosa]
MADHNNVLPPSLHLYPLSLPSVATINDFPDTVIDDDDDEGDSKDSDVDELNSDHDPVVAASLATCLTPLVPLVTLDTLVIPAGLREENLPADFRQKLVSARASACSECVSHRGTQACVQTNAASWKCRSCLRMARGCEWQRRTVDLLGATGKRPPVDMALRHRLEREGLSVDRARDVRSAAPRRRAPATKALRTRKGAPAKSNRRKGPKKSEGSSAPSANAGPSDTSLVPGPGCPSSLAATQILERIADRVDRIVELLERVAERGEDERGVTRAVQTLCPD